jgi:hypothetical protein
MAKEPKNLSELFHDTLKDIYFAEKKILATLPKMAKAGWRLFEGQLRSAHVRACEGRASSAETELRGNALANKRLGTRLALGRWDGNLSTRFTDGSDTTRCRHPVAITLREGSCYVS